MMQVLRTKEGAPLAIFDEGELVVGSATVAKWFTEGVPGIQAKAQGDNVMEEATTVLPDDPLFHLALLEHIDEEGYELDEVIAKAGANIQLELPAKPTNPHDVQGVAAFLLDVSTPGDHVRIVRDPSIYEFHEDVDWVWTIADAQGRAKNIVTPDETDNRAEENRKMVERVQKQVTDTPRNTGTPRDTKWEGQGRPGAERFPPEDDSERTIQKSKVRRRAATIQESTDG